METSMDNKNSYALLQEAQNLESKLNDSKLTPHQLKHIQSEVENLINSAKKSAEEMPSNWLNKLWNFSKLKALDKTQVLCQTMLSTVTKELAGARESFLNISENTENIFDLQKSLNDMPILKFLSIKDENGRNVFIMPL